MKKMKKALSLMLVLSMVLSYVPVPALAEETCDHHVHDQSLCGYVEAVAGAPCGHQCGEECQTELAEDGVTLLCLSHVCPDGDCGYVAAVEGSACTYECADCAAAQTPVCTGEADCPVSEHNADCAKKLADDQAAAEAAAKAAQEQPVCTGEADCPVSEHNADCAKKLADEAAAEAAAKAAADRAAADAVAAMIAALPTLEQIQAKDQAGRDADNLLVQEAYNAYRALTEEQQALLPDAPAALQAYFDFFSAPPALAAEIHSHRICGSSCSHSHTAVEWTALPVLFDALTSGYYYLENSKTIIDAIQIKGDVFLCLNGNTLTQSDAFNAITVSGSGSLTICDCGGTGVITNTKTGDAGSSCIYVSDRGSLTVYGGKIAGAQFEAIAFDSTGSLEIHGGTVTGAADAVTVRSANDITVTGGSITASVGSGISCDNASFRNLTVSGGYIEGKACGVELGTVTCTGKVEISGGTLYGKGPVPNTTTYAKDYYGLSYASGAANSCRINITGGTVYGARGGVYNNNPSASITVSGGTVGSGSQKEAGIKLSKGELRIENGKVYGLSSEGTSTATVTGGQLQYAWLTGTAPQALQVYGGTIGRVDGSTSAYGINAALVTTSSTCGIQIYGGTIVGTDHAVRNNSVHSYQISGGTLSGGKADLFWNMAPDSPSQAYLSLKDYSGEPLSVELGLSVAVGSYIARDVSRSGLITLTGSDYEATYDATGKTVRLAEKANCDAGHDFNTNHVCTRCGAIGGTCGENLTWTFDGETGTLTVSGSGEMADYEYSGETPWAAYVGEVTEIVLPEGLTTIGEFAFADLTKLTGIVVPDSVESIGTSAFRGCSSLKSVDLGDGCSLSEGVFWNCPIETLELGETVSFGEIVFNSSKLTSVTVSANSPRFDDGTFCCANLKEVHFTGSAPERIKENGPGTETFIPSFGDVTFYYDCSQDGWTNSSQYNAAEKTWAGYALVAEKHAVVTDHAVAAGCTTAGKTEGSHCSVCDTVLVEQTVIPAQHDTKDGICSVCQVFGWCGDEITWTFDEATGTVNITGTGAMTNYPYSYSTGPWGKHKEKVKKVVIGEGVTTVGKNAFYDCQYLEEVQLPSTMTVIGTSAFDDCYKLQKINLPEGITDINYRAFSNCYTMETLVLPKTLTYIGGLAFEYCSALKEIKIPNGVTSISSEAFKGCTGLTEVVIPRSVTSIGSYAFAYCESLTEVKFPQNLTSIGDRAFTECDNLKTITFMGDCPTTIGIAENPYVFINVTATVYYPQDNATWTADKRQNYGGTLNWVAKQINAGDYGLTVAGIKVTDEALSGNGWSYDPDENVLYLTAGFQSYVSHKAEKLEIVVDGAVSCASIMSDGSLTIRGKTGRSADSLSIGGRLNTGGPDLKIEDLSVTVSFNAGNNGNDSAIVASGCLTVTGASLKGICSGNSAYYGIYVGTLVVQGNSYVYGSTTRNGMSGIYATQNGSSFSSSCHVEATTNTGTGFRVGQTTLPAYGYFYSSGVSGTTMNYVRKASSEVFSSTGYGSNRDFAFVGTDHASYHQNSDGTTHSLYCGCKTYGLGAKIACSGGTATCTEKAVCDVCKEEYGSEPDHSFTKQDTDSKYQATSATCNSPATYYFSCSGCGEKGTETFAHGGADATKHTLVKDVCADCGAVKISEVTFPDAAFRAYVQTRFEAGIVYLTPGHLEALTDIHVNNMDIRSLAGIEYFTGLETLSCSGNKLTSLDLSANTALQYVDCSGNRLTSLNVGANTALKTLNCQVNRLGGLDVSGATALEELFCFDNELTGLDVSGNAALVNLSCFTNQLGSLDLSSNTALKTLDCSNNLLTGLDVSGNTALETVTCYGNQLKDLQVSGAVALENLDCRTNLLTGLDVSGCPELYHLDCSGNQLICLDLSNNPELGDLVCNNNSRAVTVANNKFDLRTLEGFDVSKASGWTGGTVSGNTLTARAEQVTYTYDLGQGRSETFTLNIDGLCTNGHDCSLPIVSTANMKTPATCVSPAVYYYVCSACGSTDADAETFTSGSADATKHTLVDDVCTDCGTVKISEITFPDDNFRDFVETLSGAEDGCLTVEECANITYISVYNEGIESLTGIEYFTGLKKLYCPSNDLTSLDVSHNTALEHLACFGNELTSLDVSSNTALKELYCSDNKLTSLDVSHNSALKSLDCSNNKLTSLNVTGSTALMDLHCSKNRLTSLDVSGLANLKNMSCSDNQLTSLDASGLVKLENLFCGGNLLTSLNVSGLTGLEELSCNTNQLTSLDVSGLTALERLSCSGNKLTGLKLGTHDALNYLDCSDNKLTALDVSGFAELEELLCYNNQLTSLKLGTHDVLQTLSCFNNQLTVLDVSGCKALAVLDCIQNQLASLDVSNNPKLRALTCYGNIRTITVKNNKFDLSTLEGFDARRATGWNGASVSGTILTATNQYPTYTYDLGNGTTEYFNLVIEGLCTNGHDFSVKEVYDGYLKDPATCVSPAVYYYKCSACSAIGTETFTHGGLSTTHNLVNDVCVDCGIVKISEKTFPDIYFREFVEETVGGADDGYLTVEERSSTVALAVVNMGIRSLTGIEYFTGLESLLCSGNKLTALDVSHNTALETLYCSDNKLAELDVSQNKALEELFCGGNALTELDVSGNAKLKKLDCGSNKLTSLDVSGHTRLMYLHCTHNKLTELNVSGCTALDTLSCANNQLTALDLSDNRALRYLTCSYNQLSSLDVSGYAELESLWCDNNALIHLNVSGCTALESLNCADNALTRLDVSDCALLSQLGCSANYLAALDLSSNPELSDFTCTLNGRTVTVTNNKFDLSSLEADGFDLDKVTEWTNATVSGKILTATAKTVTYTYASGSGITATFTLSIDGLCTNGHDFSAEVMGEGTLKTPATCVAPAVYWYSCTACGTNGTETFNGSEADVNGHDLVNEICSVCEALKISDITFPDAAFRDYVMTLSVENAGYLTTQERGAVTEIKVINREIASLAGIEYFPQLQKLNCTGNQLTSLDMSKNPALKELRCGSNRLTSLDVSGNPELTTLVCAHNQLKTLDVSGNTGLKSLDCTSNQLTGLNIRSNTALTSLICDSNRLTELDVTNNTALKSLFCCGNQLTALNVSENAALEELRCYNNQLSSLGLGGNPALKKLHCNNNAITYLNVSVNPALEVLNCGNNQLESLDLSANKALKTLYCHNNQLERLDMSGNGALEYLHCENNGLTALDLSNNPALLLLLCDNNRLTSLDLSNNTALQSLSCMPQERTVSVKNNKFDLSDLEGFDISKASGWSGGSVKGNILTAKAQQVTYQYAADERYTLTFTLNIDGLCTNGHDGSLEMITVSALKTPATCVSPAVYYYCCSACGSNSTETFTYGSAEPDNHKLVNGVCSYCEVVQISGTTFPDAVFRAHVKTYDGNGDGYLTAAERNVVEAIDVSASEIADLTGIGYFTKLKSLNCMSNKLTGLDLSRNTALENLDCSANKLGELDLSNNTALKKLDCGNNRLTGLDLSSNTALESLRCFENKLASLNTGSSTALKELDCVINRLTELDVSRNTGLKKLECSANYLTSLNVSGLTALEKLICNSNELTSLDVSSLTALEELRCSSNALASLDVSSCQALYVLDCGDNQLSSLKLGVSNALDDLNCNNNRLTTLDVSGCKVLGKLNCGNNYLTSLDVSQNPLLWIVECEGNIRTVTVANNKFDLSSLEGFDVSRVVEWTGGFVSGSVLTATDPHVVYTYDLGNEKTATFILNIDTLCVYGHDFSAKVMNDSTLNTHATCGKAATYFYTCTACGGNGTETFTSGGFDPSRHDLEEGICVDCGAVNISSVTFPDAAFRAYVETLPGAKDGYLTAEERNAVTEIDVSGKSIFSLDGIGFFTKLTKLNCSNNQLTELDVSRNTALTVLYCTNNQLTELDVSKNTALTGLYCANNQLKNLDVRSNEDLTELVCNDNQLTGLDTGCNPKLKLLNLDFNLLTELDVSGHDKLETLKCMHNRLTKLNVSGCTALKALDVSKNILTDLVVVDEIALETLLCYDNALKTLYLVNNTKLKELNCSGNQMVSLDVSHNKALTKLVCFYNQLVGLDLSGNTELKEFSGYDNRRTITVKNNRFDLRELEEDGFDVNKASKWTGGKVAGKILSVTHEQVTYVYDLGGGRTETFKLDIDGLCTNGHTFGNWYETKAPTQAAEGEQRRDCSVCGGYETRKTDRLPAVIVSEDCKTMSIVHVGDANHTNVRFAVWSEQGGQDDIKWYTAVKDASGAWTYTVDLTKHNTVGKYYIHVYAGSTYLGSYTANVEKLAITSSVTVSEDCKTMSIVHAGNTDQTGVRFAVWSEEGGKDDLKWYTAAKDATGAWTYTVDLTKHNTVGKYYIHAYAGNTYLKAYTANVAKLAITSRVTVSEDCKTMTIVHVGNTDQTSVRFAVWSEEGGQDDIQWYTAAKDATGAWTYTVDLTKHNTVGKYSIHAYAGSTYLGYYTANVAKLAAAPSGVTVSEDCKTMTIVHAGDANQSKVSFAVWSDQGGQDDIQWYTAAKDASGAWTYTVDLTKHNTVGKYNIHAYAGSTYLGCYSANVAKLAAAASGVTVSEDCKTMTIVHAGDVNQSKVSFAVWSDQGGQDDIQWYTAVKNASGAWTYTVDLTKHNTAGKYNIHAYAGSTYLGSYTANVAKATK